MKNQFCPVTYSLSEMKTKDNVERYTSADEVPLNADEVLYFLSSSIFLPGTLKIAGHLLRL
jgi:hypothetical protein